MKSRCRMISTLTRHRLLSEISSSVCTVAGGLYISIVHPVLLCSLGWRLFLQNPALQMMDHIMAPRTDAASVVEDTVQREAIKYVDCDVLCGRPQISLVKDHS